MFKVEIRKNCKICKEPLTIRQRTFCSTKCRNKTYTIKYAEKRKEWVRNKTGEYADNKIECLICGKYYRQVGSHIFGTHKMTARQYREDFELEVKKGILPDDLQNYMQSKLLRMVRGKILK